MSITSALSSALSGLSATSRQAEVLSSNVANATTPGYARREVQLGAAVLAGTGQGVAVLGISRDVDQFLINERRLSQAGDGERSTTAAFLGRVEDAVGLPDEPGSISARIAALESALIEATGRPDVEARLAAVAASALSLADGLNTASQDMQSARATADRDIGTEVDRLNGALGQIHELNTELRSFSAAGYDVSALLDQRQKLIDAVAQIVPLREMPRGPNQVALYTMGGVALVDGTAAVLGFTPTNTITPDMTQASGALSGLTVNGRPVDTAGVGSPILGGRLAALFAVRDDLAVSAQGRLDAVARDLVERFSQPGLDPTLAPGTPGLFTDRGLALVPADEVGLAGRLRLNAAVDPAQGGALFRLRDGLGAATAGAPGNGGLLVGLGQALSVARPLASTGFTAGSRSLAGLMADVLSDTATRRLSADSQATFTAARLSALSDLEKQDGVDTDQEMQMLLVIEKNYAANAKVIQTVSDMINTLIGLGS
ncbi:MAG: flagellar hook-associated protein FlgK [Tabrizicola sp.]|uniref:flagellar hook-associated protein FlgK n=1 Tax=Tabrizicola sp. TaxID=2005166 RepID=UPI002735B847|nr:flagellar hook-associated protein FlgK [Tabrizicola sp.]MDP3262129.1 flagellar hook-associated protein FlgK [Tabrizicola sp.]MDP3648125.1 flagellar hook-associated protein FlgK [Paracoccaceae bacterium]MDZ4069636.1 flagellar hook-associated protein FlgK [Tabrizicola sp.]